MCCDLAEGIGGREKQHGLHPVLLCHDALRAEFDGDSEAVRYDVLNADRDASWCDRRSLGESGYLIFNVDQCMSRNGMKSRKGQNELKSAETTDRGLTLPELLDGTRDKTFGACLVSSESGLGFQTNHDIDPVNHRSGRQVRQSFDPEVIGADVEQFPLTFEEIMEMVGSIGVEIGPIALDGHFAQQTRRSELVKGIIHRGEGNWQVRCLCFREDHFSCEMSVTVAKKELCQSQPRPRQSEPRPPQAFFKLRNI